MNWTWHFALQNLTCQRSLVDKWCNSNSVLTFLKDIFFFSVQQFSLFSVNVLLIQENCGVVENFDHAWSIIFLFHDTLCLNID